MSNEKREKAWESFRAVTGAADNIVHRDRFFCGYDAATADNAERVKELEAQLAEARATIERIRNLVRFDVVVGHGHEYEGMEADDNGDYLKWADAEGALEPVRKP